MEELLSFVPDRQGPILDVACGEGETTRYLTRYWDPGDVVGINISPRQIEVCRQLAPGCEFAVMNATDTDFEDESFETIICVEAAFHFDTRADFVSEAHRLLVPGGRLVLSDILFSRHTARAFPRAMPPGNHVRSIGEYRSLYSDRGFDVSVIDATEECWLGFSRAAYRFLTRKVLTRSLHPAVYRSLLLHMSQRRATTRKYLLVGARKVEEAAEFLP
jgi:SAM-dependent methyltransferase